MKIKLKIDLVEDESPYSIIENIVDYRSVSFGKSLKELIIAVVRIIKTLVISKLKK